MSFMLVVCCLDWVYKELFVLVMLFIRLLIRMEVEGPEVAPRELIMF